MTDIDVVATIPLRPDAAEAAERHLTELADATRAEEGCVAYALYRSQATPGLFITVERWRSQTDLDAHVRTAHVARAFEVLTPSLAGEVAINPLAPVS